MSMGLRSSDSPSVFWAWESDMLVSMKVEDFFPTGTPDDLAPNAAGSGDGDDLDLGDA
jgi:hypothetical protein